MTSNDDSRLMSIEELADRLGVSQRTVRRLIKQGQITIHRIGRAIRISERDYQIYLRYARTIGQL